jgi:hypothetical protein
MMEQYIVSARLAPGKARDAERELETGPPFDPADVGLSAHAAYLTEQDIYLVFEGEAARSRALQVARDHLVEVSRWQSIIRGLPERVGAVPADARLVYDWKARP